MNDTAPHKMLCANYVLPGHGHRTPVVTIAVEDMSGHFNGAGAVVLAAVPFNIDCNSERERVVAALEEQSCITGIPINPDSLKSYAPKVSAA